MINKIRRFIYWMKNDSNVVWVYLWTTIGIVLPDKLYLRVLFRLRMGYWMSFSRPKRFAEKLQWLKLYDRQERFHQMVDKYDVKSFIKKNIGEEYAVPTLGVWNCFEDINLEELPNSFILKATFDSGSYYICKDKNQFDKEQARRLLTRNWRHSYYTPRREWPYKGLKRRIIAEPLLAEPNELKEYKFFCYEGEPRWFQSCLDRNRDLGGAILNFFNMDGSPMAMRDKTHGRNEITQVLPPKNLSKMIEFARVFAKGTHFLRVDIYEVKNHIYIGELTFYEAAGFCEFEPDEWNIKLGDWIKLPTDTIK